VPNIAVAAQSLLSFATFQIIFDELLVNPVTYIQPKKNKRFYFGKYFNVIPAKDGIQSGSSNFRMSASAEMTNEMTNSC
jgi:hypothetical protein